MAVAPDKIAAIRDRCNIATVVGQHVALKKSGRNLVGLCPFHTENTPSFSVSPEKNFYHCFGCQAGGDVFDFVMRHDGVDFASAVRQLGAQAGIAVEPESPRAQQLRQAKAAAARLCKVALGFFVDALWSPRGAPAKAYLQARRVPPAQARARQLGFGDTAEAFLQHMQKRGFDVEALRAAGLLPDQGQRHLFVGRLIFPIFELDGEIAGFGGRRLSDDKSIPKYINSRDSILFQKRALLYGMHEAQSALRRSRRVVVVEGYTDVLAMERAQVPEAVAALGTAFSSDHAQACKRFAKEAVVVMDGDAAGLKAARDVAMALLQAGLKTRVAPLPTGEDPDSVVRTRGPTAIAEAMAAARPAVEYFMEVAFATSTMSIEERAAAAKGLEPLLTCIESGLERDLYTHRLAEKVGVPVEALRRHWGAGKPPFKRSPVAGLKPEPQASKPSGATPAPTPPTGPEIIEFHLLRDLLLFPHLRARFGELAEYALTPAMAGLLDDLAQNTAPAAEIIVAHVREPRWRRLLTQVEPLSQDPLDDMNSKSNRTFEDALACLKRRHLDTALQSLLKELHDLEARGEATDTLLRRKQELTARKRALRYAGQSARVSK